MSFDGHEDHRISLAEGAEFTARYRAQMSPGQIKGGFFGRDALLTLLSQEDCAGIRYYYGLDADGQQVLVLAGVDTRGNDQIGEGFSCMEKSKPCPPDCGAANILNGD